MFFDVCSQFRRARGKKLLTIKNDSHLSSPYDPVYISIVSRRGIIFNGAFLTGRSNPDFVAILHFGFGILRFPRRKVSLGRIPIGCCHRTQLATSDKTCKHTSSKHAIIIGILTTSKFEFLER